MQKLLMIVLHVNYKHDLLYLLSQTPPYLTCKFFQKKNKQREIVFLKVEGVFLYDASLT